MRRALLALVTLVAGCVYVFSTPDDDAGRTTVDAHDTASEPRAPAMLRGAAPGPGAQPVLPEDTTLGDDKPETKPAAPSPNDALSVTVRVAGAEGPVVFNPPATLGVWPVTYRIDSTSDFDYAEIQVAETGDVTFDVTIPLQEYRRRRSSRGINVVLRHPGYAPARVLIPVPPAGQPLERVGLVLRTRGRLVGQVVTADGAPWSGAELFLYPMTAEGPSASPVAETQSDEKGAFELQYAADGRFLLVATWQLRVWVQDFARLVVRARRKPASTQLDLVVGQPPSPVRLELGAAYALRGRVLVDGIPTAATVAWATAGRRMSDTFDLGWHVSSGFVFADGEVHSGWDDQRTDEAGRFEIPGLSAREHTLTVRTIRNTLLHKEITHQVQQAVIPPRADVVFDIGLARLELVLTHAGASFSNIDVKLMSTGMGSGVPSDLSWDTRTLEVDANGRASLRVSPKGRYAVLISEPLYAHVHEEFIAPAAGMTHTVRAHLSPVQARGRLRVTLAGPGADGLTVAAFGLYPPDKTSTQQSPSSVHVAKPVDGQFLLEDMPAGRYRMHVRPGRTWNSRPTEWVEATTLIEIAPTGETAVRIPVSKGGALHLTVVDAHDRPLPAACQIEDAAGVPVTASFVTGDNFGDTIISAGKLSGVGPSWVEPVLAPGTYTVTFTHDGFRTETRRVEISAGRPSLVQVSMSRLR